MGADDVRLSTTSKQQAKTRGAKKKVFAGDKQEKASLLSFSVMRIIIGACLAIFFVFKDLFCVILCGILRLLTETVRWFIKVIVRLGEELTATFVRVIVRAVHEFFNTIFDVILQIVDNGRRVVIPQCRQIIGVVSYSFMVVAFAVVYIIHRIISFFFPER